jgi:hypothetical protein
MKIKQATRVLLITVFSFTLLVGCIEDDIAQNQFVKGDVLLYSQDDVNLFVDRHKDIRSLVIGGKLIIGSLENTFGPSDIHDISGLSNIVEVTGNLQVVNNPGLGTTAGLQNIRRVGDNFNISRNENLTALTFDNLKTVQGQFIIYWNKSIGSMDGFTGLTSVGSYFTIGMNESLVSLDGLGALDTLYSVNITNNPALTDISTLTNLVWIKDDVLIDGNPSLRTLSGLEKLQYVGGDFLLDKGCLECGNESLKEIKLISITFIGGDCKLSNNTNAEVIDFPRLTEIKGALQLDGFAKLSGFEGFKVLSKIGGDLSVKNNQRLSELNGFSNLASLGGSLRIHANEVLKSMDFGGLKFAEFISVTKNPGIISFDGFFMSGIVINNGVEASWNKGLNDLCSLKPLIDKVKASTTNAVIVIVNNGNHKEGEYTNDYSWIKANCK